MTGKTLLRHLLAQSEHSVSFVQDILFHVEDGMIFSVGARKRKMCEYAGYKAAEISVT
jgi:hypothetical protein